MKKGDIYTNFGCTWLVDRVYKVDPEIMKKYERVYPVRYSAHVIAAPAGYDGAMEIDAALREE